jgi:hypothetical protein
VAGFGESLQTWQRRATYWISTVLTARSLILQGVL